MKKKCDCSCHRNCPKGVASCSKCGVTYGRHSPNHRSRHTSIMLSYVGRLFPISEVKTWTDDQRQQAEEWVVKCLRERPEPPEFLKPENCVPLRLKNA